MLIPLAVLVSRSIPDFKTTTKIMDKTNHKLKILYKANTRLTDRQAGWWRFASLLCSTCHTPRWYEGGGGLLEVV